MLMALEERAQLNDFVIVEKWKTTTPKNILQICTHTMNMLITHTHTHTHTTEVNTYRPVLRKNNKADKLLNIFIVQTYNFTGHAG